jgi:regulator of sigma E protease
MFAALQGILSWIPIGLPAFLFVVTVVVFFHELGHFTVARVFGVRIETFSIGFGPAIAHWFDRKGTQWKISWVPLGGYVKFFGDMSAASTPDREKIETMSAAERAEAFPFKPLYQRALIVLAGPVANFILAILIFFASYALIGEPIAGTGVGDVTKGGPAASAGIQKGDVIKVVNGQTTDSFAKLRQAIEKAGNKPLAMTVDRHGRPFTTTAKPSVIATKDIFGTPMKIRGIGIAPADEAWNVIFVKVSPLQAARDAGYQTFGVAELSLTYVWRIVSGRADTSQLTGPVGMAEASRKAASSGFVYLIGLAALISVSIGLINLFPIPILDGGHLLYYACEAVLGRPLGERAQDVGFRLGLAVVLGLFFLATWNDLVRPNLF